MTTPQGHLFVYGSLLSTANHAMGTIMRRYAKLAGKGSIQARMYIIPDPVDSTNSYPGAIPSGDPSDRVFGEIYAVTGDAPRLLATLDEFEHCSPGRPEPFEFLRRKIDVTRDDGTPLPAICYLYTWDVAKARHVTSGRFEGDGSAIR